MKQDKIYLKLLAQRDRFVPLATDDLQGEIIDRYTMAEYRPHKMGSGGYLHIKLPDVGIISMHRAINIIKFGDIYLQDDIVTRHLNGNKLDNSPDNIAIGTQKDNMQDIPPEQRIGRAKKTAETLGPEGCSARAKKGSKKRAGTLGPEGYSAGNRQGYINRGFIPPTKEQVISIDELYLETGWGGINIKKELELDLKHQVVGYIIHRTGAWQYLPQPIPPDWPEYLIYPIPEQDQLDQRDLFECYERER